MDIQVDMFEVQLGAAILLQFWVDGKPIRVLADAGVKASGYRTDHVLNKLLPMVPEGKKFHIDLLIGTHYDEDHLTGFLPIIEHDRITIGEAWLPPVANDSEPHALDARLSEGDMLAHQFHGDETGDRLEAYVQAKATDISQLDAVMEKGLVDAEKDRKHVRMLRLSETASLDAFRQTLADDDRPDVCNHAPDFDTEPNDEVEKAIARARGGLHSVDVPVLGPKAFWSLEEQLRLSKWLEDVSPRVSPTQMKSLFELQKSSARDAINASALHAVARALASKRIQMRTQIIEDGEPKRYAWRAASRRFVLAARSSDVPAIMLLGPSRSLVKKHWNRLPVRVASKVALSFYAEIKSITPSNQLSYVFRAEHKSQGILISGDAGCVDFKQDRTSYYPRLLQAMQTLHVIQVAHHGGNNAHFYRVLEASGYPEQMDNSFLLLSHATADRFRPSEEFRHFLLGTLDRGDDVRLLFTSQPTAERSRDFAHAFHKVEGEAGDRGDVCLRFKGG